MGFHLFIENVNLTTAHAKSDATRSGQSRMPVNVGSAIKFVAAHAASVHRQPCCFHNFSMRPTTLRCDAIFRRPDGARLEHAYGYFRRAPQHIIVARIKQARFSGVKFYRFPFRSANVVLDALQVAEIVSRLAVEAINAKLHPRTAAKWPALAVT